MVFDSFVALKLLSVLSAIIPTPFPAECLVLVTEMRNQSQSQINYTRPALIGTCDSPLSTMQQTSILDASTAMYSQHQGEHTTTASAQFLFSSRPVTSKIKD